MRIVIALAKSLRAILEGLALFLLGVGGSLFVTLPLLILKTMGIVADVLIICSKSAYGWMAQELEKAWE